MIKDLAKNLYAGARLCFMLPVNRGDFRASQDQAFVLLVVGSASILLVEYFGAEGDWFPTADNVGFYALGLLAGLVGCFAATRLLAIAEPLSTIVVILLAGAFWLVPVFGPIFALTDAEMLAPNKPAGIVVGIAIVFWFLAIAMRSIHMIAGGGIVRPAVAASILMIFTALPKLLLTAPATWMAAPAKLPQSWTQENLYYGQFGMMDRSVSWLAKNRPGVPDLYFVGFGADAKEPVFVNEMRSVAQLFENRFGAKDRSLVMLNNPDTIRHAPLANIHNLGRTLSEIGKQMNGDEDVIFLYLSTPALHNGEVEPKFAPLDFAPIHPSLIRHMLDDADIKYRIIVLSSCGADGFIDHLRGPTTLVIAASGTGQRARGCNGDAPFTDFGAAFFGEGLRDSFSIPEAFNRATALTAEQDAAILRRPSAPAIFIGSEISGKLTELTDQLESDYTKNTSVPTVTMPQIGSTKTRKQR